MAAPRKGTATPLGAVFSPEETKRAVARVDESIADRRAELGRLQGFVADNAALASLVNRLPDELSHDIMVPFGGASHGLVQAGHGGPGAALEGLADEHGVAIADEDSVQANKRGAGKRKARDSGKSEQMMECIEKPLSRITRLLHRQDEHLIEIRKITNQIEAEGKQNSKTVAELNKSLNKAISVNEELLKIAKKLEAEKVDGLRIREDEKGASSAFGLLPWS